MPGRKRILATIVVMVLAIFSISVIFAQDSVDDQGNTNDPNVNDRANACFTGGSMEGKCGNSSLLWGAGWYLIRFQYGIFTREQVPSFLAWVLPPPPPEGEVAGAFCTIDIGMANASSMWMSSSIVHIPLSVINGADPNASPGATPYGFDWSVGVTESFLYMYGPNTGTAFTVWYTDSTNSDWNPGIIANDCPTPTPPK